MSDIQDLLDRYWQLAYAEGRENRQHDTESGDAQECRSAIDVAILDLEMRALVAKPLYSRRQLQERIAELEKALEPFVALIERSDAMDLEYLEKNAPGMDIEAYTPSTDKIVSSGEMRSPIYITRGDFRAARTALDAVKER